jgi:hypothetical protein
MASPERVAAGPGVDRGAVHWEEAGVDDGAAPVYLKYGDIVTLCLDTSDGPPPPALPGGGGGGSEQQQLLTADGVADARLKSVSGDPRAAGTYADCLFMVAPQQTYTARRELEKFEGTLAASMVVVAEPEASAAVAVSVSATAAMTGGGGGPNKVAVSGAVDGHLKRLRAAARKEAAANAELVVQRRGAPALYGDTLQLQHVKSGKVRVLRQVAFVWLVGSVLTLRVRVCARVCPCVHACVCLCVCVSQCARGSI